MQQDAQIQLLTEEKNRLNDQLEKMQQTLDQLTQKLLGIPNQQQAPAQMDAAAPVQAENAPLPPPAASTK
jgi:prefoldin subunit 5